MIKDLKKTAIFPKKVHFQVLSPISSFSIISSDRISQELIFLLHPQLLL